jgi:hypothetical protein
MPDPLVKDGFGNGFNEKLPLFPKGIKFGIAKDEMKSKK